MDLIHKLMNIIVPPLGLTMLLFFLPTYLFFKLLISTIKSIFSEDVAGKVILITGASSGIGEHLAYEYARRGAFLALIARRENRLREVASTAYQLGSPEVIVIPADVSKVEDCKRFVDETAEHFGQLDHLVNNAGITPVCIFEQAPDITNLRPAMDVNFWGAVYATYFAVPHLKRSKGKIVTIASSAAWLPAPRLSFYTASKAAVLSFFETLRVELGGDIGITIVTPGLIESEMTQGKFLSEEGQMVLDPEMRDILVSIMPIEPVGKCAKAIVDGACRGEKYLTEPAWMRVTYFWKVFCPEILEWCNQLLLTRPGSDSERDTPSKRLLDLTGLKKYIYPESVQFPELKAATG
ncbi:11-beta-hydroxysteroid dehydrogenase A-like [Juglans microcarpa x Juglans regia]|uniref:11-beta-hydroxysteroid dehydrogenase A-like n=1 Tax=Juglans microcarpa x Juglans regia TaxID=2249226 RepID=UPI001B7EC9C7|nr:11-beta-hydroxysteroid dehydrogenase A-like [Juglans microcarpa x Juglans regia]